MTAELCAIVLALEFAVQSVKNEETTNKPKVVKIFTDSQSSLRQIAMSSKLSHRNRRKQEGMEDLLQAIVQAAESLETDRVQLEFHWVPRGRVVGNILADKAARLARTAHRLTSNDWVQLDWDLVAEGSSLKLDSDTTNDRTVFGMRRQILASKMVMANQVVLYLPSKTRPGFELSKDMSGSREENDGQRPKTD
ncbi:hypothetical protein AK830_g6786 [Neonectria ditissima]|uniref:RNase H type-1 domain-containing protein n=1 Tax=Neonectria ditissima TaxID=78410 RepID=A0A0P7BHP3_9HYPO|nr:hypothetical protein AK830_g6786 [Neonectria ditissima]